jgi:AcrR family transcriptional regulator
MSTTFQRARSEEQRAERRLTILETAAGMLTEMPVAKLSLNELSRRVGLAKSNVLRYFETREAVLLELLNAELDDWVDALEQAHQPSEGTPTERANRIAVRVASSLAERPVLCDLISAQAAVLEHNVSTEIALRHKQATHRMVERLQRLILGDLPELNEQEAYVVVATTLLMCSAAWPRSQPSEAVLAAYAADEEIAAHQMDFADWMRQTLELTISGLGARRSA